DYQRYYLTSAAFAEAHPQVLQSVFNELVKAGEWLRANPREAAEQLGPLWGNLEPQIVEQAHQRRSYEVRAVQRESLVEQQKIADAFFNEGLLPSRIDASDVALWKPEAAQWLPSSVYRTFRVPSRCSSRDCFLPTSATV